MNRDDIIRMAREAGFSEWAVQTPKDLERFAALVAAAERERIKVANASEIEKINAHIRVLEDAVAAERERVTFELVNEAQRAVQEAVWAEREACAKSCLNVEVSGHTFNAGAAPMEFAYQVATATAFDCAAAIRNRVDV